MQGYNSIYYKFRGLHRHFTPYRGSVKNRQGYGHKIEVMDFNYDTYNMMLKKYGPYIDFCTNLFSMKEEDMDSELNKLFEFADQYPIDVLTTIQVLDNAITFRPIYKKLYFEMFQKLTYHFNFNIFTYKLPQSFMSLLRIGPDPIELQKAFDIYPRNSLNYIIMHDDLTELQHFILDLGLDEMVKKFNKENFNSLIEYCCKYGSLRCFRFLRNNHIKLTQTCLVESFAGGNNDIILECMNEFKPDLACLMKVVQTHNNDMISTMISDYSLDVGVEFLKDMPPNLYFYIYMLCRLPKDDTLFPLSSIFGITELIHDLKASGFNINSEFNYKHALDISLEREDTESVMALIDCGHKVNYHDESGKTPLIKAVDLGNIDTVLKLIDAGAFLNDTDNNGSTALIHAAQYQHFDIAVLLIDKDADYNIMNYNGYTLLSLTRSMEIREAISRKNLK